MTEEQERLVIDNHSLIYHFIHKFGVPIDEEIALEYIVLSCLK